MSSLFGPATEDDRWRCGTYQLIERQAAQRGGTTVERPYSRGSASRYTEPAPLRAPNVLILANRRPGSLRAPAAVTR